MPRNVPRGGRATAAGVGGWATRRRLEERRAEGVERPWVADDGDAAASVLRQALPR